MTPETLFKALSDPTRLRCVLLLAEHPELCVCDITHALALPQPKVSRHLGNRRKAGLVLDRKEGLWCFYRLHPQLPDWVRELIEATRRGVAGQAPFIEDQARLEETARQASSCG